MRQNRNRKMKSRRRGGQGESRKQWDTWIGTNLLQMCSRFCNSSATTGQMREGIITPAGLQTCNIVNEEETYYSQGDSPTIASDSSAERPTPRPSYCSNKNERRNSAPYSESEYADGARSPAPGEFEAFRLRRTSIKSNA